MKRIISLFLVIVMVFSFSSVVFASSVTPTVKIQQKNGSFVTMKSSKEYGSPYIDSNGRTMVPLRLFVESIMEHDIYGNSEFGITYASSGPHHQVVSIFSVPRNLHYDFIIGDKKIYKSDGSVYKTMDTVPVIKNDRTYIPLRYAVECLQFTVKWNDSTKTATCYRK